MVRPRLVNRFFALVIATLVALAATFNIQAQSETGSGESGGSASAQAVGVESKVITPAEQKAALTRMTRDVIAKAKPMSMPAQRGAATVDVPAQAAQEATGAPQRTAGGLAAPDADRVARAAYPRDWRALKPSSAPTDATAAEQPADEMVGTSQVFSNYTVNQASALQTLYPHRWVGRLTFTTPGGTSFCSGTSISGNVMLTAAHCIYDSTNNRFYSNWVFAPAYRNGSAPFGTFAATRCFVLTAWINLSGSYAINTWARHDVGVCNMGLNSSGTTLNNAVGFMGRQWNFSYIRHFHDLGYPFRDYNNALLTNAGLYLRACVAESFQQTTETRGLGCRYGGGISGGPWVAGYAVNVATGWADGVNSGIFTGTQNMYGARFNSNNIVPLCTAAGC